MVGEPREVAENALALAQLQQEQGLFAAAHAKLLEALLALKTATESLKQNDKDDSYHCVDDEPSKIGASLYNCLLRRLSLIHSYLLVPRLLKQGDQYTAALLLIRTAAHIGE